MNSKTLYLHAGGSKTGSSSIQHFLNTNSHLLNKEGFSHLNQEAHLGYVCGNGKKLFDLLTSNSFSLAELDSVLKSYFGSNLNAICSKEDFSILQSREWLRLRAGCKRNRIKIVVIFYVRNTIPFLSAFYDQELKQGVACGEFAEHILKIDWLHSIALRRLAQVFPPENLLVLHYEANRKRLIPSFLKALGLIHKSWLKLPGVNTRLNRSLTNFERRFLLEANPMLGRHHGTELANFFLELQPDLKSEEIEVKSSVILRIKKRYAADVDWINHQFFNGAPQVSLGNHGQKPTPQSNRRKSKMPTKSSEKQINTVGLVLAWAFHRLAKSTIESSVFIANSVESINWSDLNNKNIPKNFDPVAYLILNTDLLLSKTNPIEHYLAFGCHEVGRKLNWQSQPAHLTPQRRDK